MSDAQQYNVRRIEIFIWILAILPILTQFWVVTEFRTDLVIRDEFRHILPRVRHLFEGNFSFLNDIWASQNVHKPVIPIGFILLNAYFAGWNVIYEQIAGFIGYVLLFVVLVRRQMRIARSVGIQPVNWTIPATALLIFSLTSWKVFYMGYAALQHGGAIFGAIAGIVVLARPGFRWKDYVLSILLGLVGTLSFSTTLLFWPAAFFILLWKLIEGRFKSVALRVAVPLWLILTKIVAVLYKTGMSDPANPMSFVAHFWKNVKFALVFTGAPIDNVEVIGAFYIAIGGLIAITLLTYGLVVHRKIEFHVLLPYFAMALFTLGAGFLTSTGRLRYGANASLTRDWKIFSTPLWIAIIVLLNLFVRTEPASRFLRFSRLRLGMAGSGLTSVISLVPFVVLIASAGLFVRSNLKEVSQYRIRHHKMVRAEREINRAMLALEEDTELRAQIVSAGGHPEAAEPLTVAERVAFPKVMAVHPKVPQRKFRKNLEFLEKNRLANFNR